MPMKSSSVERVSRRCCSPRGSRLLHTDITHLSFGLCRGTGAGCYTHKKFGQVKNYKVERSQGCIKDTAAASGAFAVLAYRKLGEHPGGSICVSAGVRQPGRTSCMRCASCCCQHSSVYLLETISDTISPSNCDVPQLLVCTCQLRNSLRVVSLNV